MMVNMTIKMICCTLATKTVGGLSSLKGAPSLGSSTLGSLKGAPPLNNNKGETTSIVDTELCCFIFIPKSAICMDYGG